MENLYNQMLAAVVGREPTELRSLFRENTSLNPEKRKEYATNLLHSAVEKGSTNLIAILLEYGANVNSTDKNGETPLHKASRGGYTEGGEYIANDSNKVVRQLLDHNASINAEDLKGRTALHKAAEEMQGKIVSILLKRGADVNSTDQNDRTPLHLAAFQGYEGYDKIVQQLLDKNASINSLDKQDNTPLHLAASEYPFRGRPERDSRVVQSTKPVIRLLLKRGADTNIRNQDGNKPLDLAKPNSEEAQLLTACVGLRP